MLTLFWFSHWPRREEAAEAEEGEQGAAEAEEGEQGRRSGSRSQRRRRRSGSRSRGRRMRRKASTDHRELRRRRSPNQKHMFYHFVFYLNVPFVLLHFFSSQPPEDTEDLCQGQGDPDMGRGLYLFVLCFTHVCFDFLFYHGCLRCVLWNLQVGRSVGRFAIMFLSVVGRSVGRSGLAPWAGHRSVGRLGGCRSVWFGRCVVVRTSTADGGLLLRR